jgi:general secretion pathway protein H
VARRHPIRRAAAFTLIEVLVVVAIAGVLIAVAAINLFPSDTQIARREASDVALALERARDRAWFGGRPTAITLADGQLRESRLTTDRWSDSASAQALPGDLKVNAIHVDGQPLDPKDRLMFLPDGFGAPFRIALDWGIEGDAAGAVRVIEP